MSPLPTLAAPTDGVHGDTMDKHDSKTTGQAASGMGAKADDDVAISGLRYLVVDDSRNARNLVKQALAMVGARHIDEAGDAAGALEVLHARPVDVVMLDNEMTPMTGIELTRVIRRDPEPRVAEVIIIMVSGFSDQPRVMAARDAGVHEFLVKPVSAKLIGERVKAVLRHPRPFERSADYIGPERRRGEAAGPDGADG